MKTNYDKFKEITVKSQQELNDIPADFEGRIYIEFGTPNDRAVVNKRYKLRVEAWGSSFVEARENSSVIARENSSVEAWGNVQIVDFLQGSKIKIAGNARIVYNPKSIIEFMDFYGIKHTKTTATFYKAVHKYDDGTYHADYSCSFDYVIGQSKTVSDIDKSTRNDCGEGIHISHLAWAVDFGKNWSDLAILEVETKIDNIVLPIDTNGKVRTSEVKVIREVPLKECGLYGKILAKRASRVKTQIRHF